MTAPAEPRVEEPEEVPALGPDWPLGEAGCQAVYDLREQVDERLLGFERDQGERRLAAMRAILYDPGLTASAVMTAVYPSGQVGKRDQETPSLKVAAAGRVIGPSFAALIDRDWLCTKLRPTEAGEGLSFMNGGGEAYAIDARLATDGEFHTSINALGGVAPRWKDDSLLSHALELYTQYTTCTMPAHVWASRRRLDDKFDVRSPTIEAPGHMLGPICVASGTILMVTGSTGSGKSRFLAEHASSEHPLAVVQPTRIAVLGFATDAARTRQEPVVVVFYAAGGQEGNSFAMVHPDGSQTPCTAADARLAPLVALTPWQASRQTAGRRHVVIDEAHELTWERAAALGQLTSAGVPVSLVTATPAGIPAKIAGATIVTKHLETTRVVSRRLTVGQRKNAPKLQEGTAYVYGTLREVVEASRDHPQAVVLHGKLSSDELEAARVRAAGSAVLTTVGVFQSAITIPGIQVVVMSASATERRRFDFGAQSSRTGGLTAGEYEQIAGRAGRTTASAHLFVCAPPHLGSTDEWGTDWGALLQTSALAHHGFAPDTDAALSGDWLSTVTTLGPLADAASVIACSYMGAPPSIVPLARAFYLALEAVGGARGVAASHAAYAEYFSAGGDPGCMAKVDGRGRMVPHTCAPCLGGVPLSDLPEEVRQGALDAFMDARVLANLTECGLFGLAPAGRWTDGVDASMSPLFRKLCGTRLVVGDAHIDGRVCVRKGMMRPPEATVADREIATMALGSSLKVNEAGTPMGGSANGPLLNAHMTQAAKCATVMAARLGVEADALTGGDDEIGENDPGGLRFACSVLMRIAGGTKINAKTGPVPAGGLTPFLERYIDAETREEHVPAADVNRANQMAKALAGNVAGDLGWCPFAESWIGMPLNTAALCSSFDIDTRPRGDGTGVPSAPRSEYMARVVMPSALPALDREGRVAGSRMGEAVVGPHVRKNLAAVVRRARMERKRAAAIELADRLDVPPRLQRLGAPAKLPGVSTRGMVHSAVDVRAIPLRLLPGVACLAADEVEFSNAAGIRMSNCVQDPRLIDEAIAWIRDEYPDALTDVRLREERSESDYDCEGESDSEDDPTSATSWRSESSSSFLGPPDDGDEYSYSDRWRSRADDEGGGW
jgi:hypothetical protein